MAHQKVAFYLLQRIQYNTDQNQQRGTAVELGELRADAEYPYDGRQNGHQREEDGAGQRDVRDNVVNEFRRPFAGFDAGDETAVLLKVFGDLLRVHRDSRVEVREHDNHECEHQVVSETVEVHEHAPKTGVDRFRGGEAGNRHGDEHDRLREDDGHNAGRIDFQRQILAYTAVLLVTDNAFGILDGNPARTLNEQDAQQDDYDQDNEFQQEYDQTAALLFETGNEFPE